MDENNNQKLYLKEIKNKLLIGLDIGGTLTKICILCDKNESSVNDFLLSNNFEKFDLNSYNLFKTFFKTINFETDFFKLVKNLNNIVKINEMDLTGGGAYKYNDIIKKNFDIELIKHDELQSLKYGYLFMNNYKSFYEIENNNIKEVPENIKFPHISANIGSGVSILKISSPEKYERVGGTLVGGGTLIGLSKLIIGIDDYDEIVELASKGNNENVDLTKKDLLKENEELKTDNDIISSLGKVYQYVLNGKKDEIKKEDIALSLLNMICYHISQYTVLYAKQSNIDTIYYFGTFIKKNSIVDKILNQASKHWNKNIKVRFNNFGGYLGTIGTLLVKK